MSADIKDTEGMEFFIELLNTQGVAVTKVNDGHVFGFTRKHLQAMLDKHPENEQFMIFVKAREFKD